MALIFRGSFLVLSAAKSPNAYGGLYAEFPSRCKTHVVEVTTNAAHTKPTTEKVYARRSLAHLSSYHSMNQWLDSGNTEVRLPTLTRGWIFQERFLAPRVLHFGPEELSWECQDHSTCQCTSPLSLSQSIQNANHHDKASNDSSAPDDTIPKFDLPTWHKLYTTRIAQPKSYHSLWSWIGLAQRMALPTESHNDEQLAACWHHLVEDYTKLQLTFEKDIFPAVSGLAHLMLTALEYRDKPPSRANPPVRENGVKKDQVDTMAPNRYVAGLWSHSLHRDLLWRASSQTTPRRPEKWRAPSWSWASVKGAVEFLSDTEGMQPKCEVVEDVAFALAGIDECGELVDVPGKNILALQGTVLSSGLSFKGPGLAGNKERKQNPRAWEVMGLDVFKKHLKNVWADDCDTERLMGGEQDHKAYCLLVGVKESKELCFLILRRVQHDETAAGGAGDMYQRIGVAEVFGGPPGPGSWKDRLFATGTVQTVRIR